MKQIKASFNGSDSKNFTLPFSSEWPAKCLDNALSIMYSHNFINSCLEQTSALQRPTTKAQLHFFCWPRLIAPHVNIEIS